MSVTTISNFDSVARPYRWMEYASFGPFLDRCRLAQLPEIGGARRALVLGDGDGRFLARLLAANPELSADVVDSSWSMLEILDRRVSKMGQNARKRIQLHHSDALSWTAKGSYDLVVSHFFLDCLFEPQIEELFDRLTPHLDRGVRWVVSEFAVPQGVPESYLCAAVVCLLYQSFGLLTGLPVRRLPDYCAALRRRGLQLERRKTFLRGLLQSQLWFLPG